MLDTLIHSGREAQRTGAWDEALAHYDAALELLSAEDAGQRADVLRLAGAVHRERGELDRAETSYQESHDVAEAAGLKDKTAAGLIALANVEILRGNLSAASALFLQAREIAETLQEDRMIAVVDQNLGVIANIQGNVAMALLSYRSALERYRRLSDDFSATRALNNMGMAHVDLSEWDAADTCFEDAASLAQKTGDTVMVGRVELNRAELYLKRRRYEAAEESCDRSLQVFHRLRVKPSIAEAYKFYGILFRETAKPEKADTHFALSLGIAEACQNKLLQAETQMEWAILHLEEERKQEGILYLNRALQLFRGLNASREVLDIERRLVRLKELYLPAVEGWGASLAESKDAFQSGHSRRVAAYAQRLGAEVGVEGESLTWLKVGAYIHDLGNTAVPAEVLQKADALSEDEREIMRVHTLMGDAMVRQLDFPDEVRPIVRSHHEQWAGTGYPDQLIGEKIPFNARIVSIADVYDALRSPRSFRAAYSEDEALGIMDKDAERMFDPKLYGVFRDLLLRGGFAATE